MTSFIADDVLCHETRNAAALFRSCTTVWRVTSLASQTLAESGTRDYRARAWPGLLSRSTFGANFSRALPGELLAALLVCVLSWALLCAVIANGCSTQVLYSPSSWLFFLRKMQSSSDEDTDSSVPLDHNHMNQT